MRASFYVGGCGCGYGVHKSLLNYGGGVHKSLLNYGGGVHKSLLNYGKVCSQVYSTGRE